MRTSRVFQDEIGGAIEPVSREELLTRILRILPSDWTLTPTYRKRPYRPNWRAEKLDRQLIGRAIKFGDQIKGENGKYNVYPDGIALIVPVGFVAVDVDGKAALALKRKLQDGCQDALTVSWTSGKEGRGTALYRLPATLADRIQALSRPIKEVKIDDGIRHYGQAIELKLAGQSVTIPPSNHPDTAGYRWLSVGGQELSPWNIEVAQAPQWVVQQIESEVSKREQIKPVSIERAQSWQELDPDSLDDVIQQALDQIDPDCHREDWFKVLCALNSVDRRELAEEWSARGAKYDARSFDKTWDSIESRDGGYTLGTLFWLAGIRPSTKGQGFKQKEDQKADRKWLIEKRMETFKEQYWPALQQDFLMAKSDRTYSGYCSDIDLGLSRTHLIQGWLGAGKSEAMLRAVKRFTDANPNKMVVWVVNRNGLGRNILTRAKKMGLQAWDYQSDVVGNRQLIEANHGGMLIMCMESLKQYAVGSIDWSNTILVIDEFRSIRASALSRSEEFPQLEQALYDADRLVVADAFLSDADRGVLKKYRGRDRIVYRQEFSKSPVKIKWIEMLGTNKAISFRHGGGYLPILDKMIEQGGRNAIASDSRTLLKVFAQYLESKGQRVLLCTSETIDCNRRVLPDPTAAIESEQPDFFLYSPTIQAGADIQAKFDRGLLVSNGILSSIDILQMLGRCRQCPEWSVSAPRFTDFENPSLNLDGKAVSRWAQQLSETFDRLGLSNTKHIESWAQWQETTGKIEKAFNSEYLYCLLDRFFAGVETVEIDPSDWAEDESETDGMTANKKLAALIAEVKNQEAESHLTARLEVGRALLAKQKQPQSDQEYWDVALAEWHDRHPEIVDLLIDLYRTGERGNFQYTNKKQTILDIARIFLSRKIDRVKSYRLACQEGIEAKLLERLQSQRFVSSQSRNFKQYRSIRLFRGLNLEQLARITASGQTVEKDKTGFTVDSPIVSEFYRKFRDDQDLAQLFPEVEGIDQFWALVRRAMTHFGFQGAGSHVRVKTEDQHQDGYKKDGTPRYTKSKVVYLSAWKIHALSGNSLWVANYQAIVDAVDKLIEREEERFQDYLLRRQLKPIEIGRSPEAVAA